jgi:hypothetical protein
MTEKGIGGGRVNCDLAVPADPLDASGLARQALRRERRCMRLLTGIATLLWLLAAAGVAFVVDVVLRRLNPTLQQLLRDSALGKLPVERMVVLQAIHFQAVKICTLIIAASFAALTLAALCTVLLVLISRRVTLHQINTKLGAINEQLTHLRLAPSNSPSEHMERG